MSEGLFAEGGILGLTVDAALRRSLAEALHGCVRLFTFLSDSERAFLPAGVRLRLHLWFLFYFVLFSIAISPQNVYINTGNHNLIFKKYMLILFKNDPNCLFIDCLLKICS